MAYSGDPTSSDGDKLRFLLGDTDPNYPVFTDSEVAYLLAQYPDPLVAAIAGCQSLIARYASQVDRSIGALSISAGQRVEHYTALLATLQGQQAMTTAIPWAGGLSVSGKDAQNSDTDRVQPAFTREMMQPQ